jgi:hypothetical protein
MQARRGGGGIAVAILNLGARRAWMVCATPRPPYPSLKDPVPIVYESGWPTEPVWKGMANLACTEVRILNRPAHDESLQGLHYPGCQYCSVGNSSFNADLKNSVLDLLLGAFLCLVSLICLHFSKMS